MEPAVAPEHVGGGEGRVAAEGNLDGRGEPPQVVVAVGALGDERRLRQVHLGGHRLHPAIGSGSVEHHHPGWVARERGIGERIDDGDRQGHPRTVRLQGQDWRRAS